MIYKSENKSMIINACIIFPGNVGFSAVINAQDDAPQYYNENENKMEDQIIENPAAENSEIVETPKLEAEDFNLFGEEVPEVVQPAASADPNFLGGGFFIFSSFLVGGIS